MDRLIQMIINMVMKQMINRGVKSGIDYAVRRGKPMDEMTPEDRKLGQDAKAMAKRARQAANLARRMGR